MKSEKVGTPPTFLRGQRETRRKKAGAAPAFSDPIVRHVASRLAARVPHGTRVCAGFSGGIDSTVLLDTLARLRDDMQLVLTAVHVHHGLSPNADAWADSCARFCAARSIPLHIERVKVDRASSRGVEAEARAARYAAFAAREADVIALAHHLDDQAETVLLQLLRGTGLKGSAAMPEWRILQGTSMAMFRPLLGVSRAAIAEVARGRQLEWIDDESNAGTEHDRNALRNDVLPRIEARFPQWRESLARFARHAASADDLLRELAIQDGVGPGVSRLSPQRQANALRGFLDAEGLAMPSQARLEEMARQLFGARGDARVRIEHDGAALVRHRNQVLIDRGAPAQAAWGREWRREPELDLGPGLGLVRFRPARGEGIEAMRSADPGWRFALRSGGERIRLQAGGRTRTLKNLLREGDRPAWQRGRIPLLFHGEDLVWVPGVGIHAPYQCARGAAGLVPEWFFVPPT